MANLIQHSPPPDSVLARRPDLAEHARDVLQHLEAGATRRAHAADWRVWEAWCTAQGAAALPATVDTAIAFLAAQDAAGKALATTLRYAATVSVAHRRRGFPSPFGDPRAREWIKALRRARGAGASRAKAAMTLDLIAVKGDDLRALRDRALLLLGHATAFRRSELTTIRVEDLAFSTEGVVIRVGRTKTDQEGRGRYLTVAALPGEPLCPVAALRAWLEAAGVVAGPVFRGFRRGGGIRATALSANFVGVVVKASARAAGLDPVRFGGHSLRAGYVTDARRSGEAWGEIMEQTGHKKVETVKRYARDEQDPIAMERVQRVAKRNLERVKKMKGEP